MKVSTELYPWRHHFLGLEGLNLNYVDEGTGPAMLMVHGNPTWSFYYYSAEIFKLHNLRNIFKLIKI